MKNILLLLLALPAVASAESSDTYNFYFQKAPGPVTVNQGAGVAPDKKSDTPPAMNSVSAAAAATPPEEAPSKRSLYLTLGYALQNVNQPGSRFDQSTGKKDQFLGSAYAIKAELDLTEHFALTGEVYRLKNSPDVALGHAYDTSSPQFSTDVKDRSPNTPGNLFDFAAGAAWSPIRLKATTFSILGGAQSMPSLHYADPLGPNRLSGVAYPEGGVHHKVYGYAGARLRLLADNVWGLDANYRYLPGADVGSAELGLTFAL